MKTEYQCWVIQHDDGVGFGEAADFTEALNTAGLALFQTKREAIAALTAKREDDYEGYGRGAKPVRVKVVVETV